MEKSPRNVEYDLANQVTDSAAESVPALGPTNSLPGKDNELDIVREPDRAEHRYLGRKILEIQDSQVVQDSDPWVRNSSFARAETEPDYENSLTELELSAHPERRFEVNPDRFPILRDQAIENQRININETLGLLVQDTADTIAKITGETDPPTRPSDAVIYLDKSARPVSWLVNELWDDFTNAPQPKVEEFMAIDRVRWLRAVGLKVDSNGNLDEDYGMSRKNRRATYDDFKKAAEKHPVSQSDIARARLLLIPNGIQGLRNSMTEIEKERFDAFDPLAFESTTNDKDYIAPELPDWIIEKIFALPTGLEGKKITIIDEVRSSGASLEIARDIVAQAVNDPSTEIATHTFWQAGTKQTRNGEAQMLSTPVWYNHDVNPELGKGIGDIRFGVMREEFLNHPDSAHLQALYIAPFRGRKLDLAGKEGESSVELMKEFQRLAQNYREGRILMSHPVHYNEDKWIEHYEKLGVEFAPNLKQKNTYVAIKESFKK